MNALWEWTRVRTLHVMQVRDTILRLYVEFAAEELRLVSRPEDLMHLSVMGSLALIEFASLTFCNSMVKIGAAHEEIAAGHPVMENAALDMAVESEAQAAAPAAYHDKV